MHSRMYTYTHIHIYTCIRAWIRSHHFTLSITHIRVVPVFNMYTYAHTLHVWIQRHHFKLSVTYVRVVPVFNMYTYAHILRAYTTCLDSKPSFHIIHHICNCTFGFLHKALAIRASSSHPRSM